MIWFGRDGPHKEEGKKEEKLGRVPASFSQGQFGDLANERGSWMAQLLEVSSPIKLEHQGFEKNPDIVLTTEYSVPSTEYPIPRTYRIHNSTADFFNKKTTAAKDD